MDGPICSKHQIPMDVERPCWICHGEGCINDPDDYCDPPGLVTCWSCKGSGEGALDCEFCIEEEQEEETR
jgi:DnaJ-class molecular chaperone